MLRKPNVIVLNYASYYLSTRPCLFQRRRDQFCSALVTRNILTGPINNGSHHPVSPPTAATLIAFLPVTGGLYPECSDLMRNAQN